MTPLPSCCRSSHLLFALAPALRRLLLSEGISCILKMPVSLSSLNVRNSNELPDLSYETEWFESAFGRLRSNENILVYYWRIPRDVCPINFHIPHKLLNIHDFLQFVDLYVGSILLIMSDVSTSTTFLTLAMPSKHEMSFLTHSCQWRYFVSYSLVSRQCFNHSALYFIIVPVQTCQGRHLVTTILYLVVWYLDNTAIILLYIVIIVPVQTTSHLRAIYSRIYFHWILFTNNSYWFEPFSISFTCVIYLFWRHNFDWFKFIWG